MTEIDRLIHYRCQDPRVIEPHLSNWCPHPPSCEPKAYEDGDSDIKDRQNKEQGSDQQFDTVELPRNSTEGRVPVGATGIEPVTSAV